MTSGSAIAGLLDLVADSVLHMSAQIVLRLFEFVQEDIRNLCLLTLINSVWFCVRATSSGFACVGADATSIKSHSVSSP